jgi:hypothetical protein
MRPLPFATRILAFLSCAVFLTPPAHAAAIPEVCSPDGKVSVYSKIPLSQMPGGHRILPLVVEAPNAIVAVGEADVRNGSRTNP